MSTPYFCCPRCSRNTPISDEVLDKFKAGENSFFDLMTCEHCGSTPEERIARRDAIWDRTKKRAEAYAKIRQQRRDKADSWQPSEKLKIFTLDIICRHLKYGEDYITSWIEFMHSRDHNLVPDVSNQKLLKAMRAGKKMGWLNARWTGVGMTPFAGSARRQRIYDITDLGKDAVITYTPVIANTIKIPPIARATITPRKLDITFPIFQPRSEFCEKEDT